MLDQPAFLNACLRIETALGPEELLDACKAVEAQLGRDLEGGVRHGPRVIDVDVLLLGDVELRERAPAAPARPGHRAALRPDPAARARLRPHDARRHAAQRLPRAAAGARRGRAPRRRPAVASDQASQPRPLQAPIRLAPGDLELAEIPIGNLPLCSQDYDAIYSPEARALKEAISASDAILFVSPVYNRSIPVAL